MITSHNFLTSPQWPPLSLTGDAAAGSEVAAATLLLLLGWTSAVDSAIGGDSDSAEPVRTPHQVNQLVGSRLG